MLHVDLFSGIGGFALGLERAGFKTIAFCEIDPCCRSVLKKHWPGIPIHEDIRNYRGEPCDILTGGFPCQPFSSAARGQHRAENFWPEMLRVVSECRPAWVVCENVAGFAGMALEQVATGMEGIGYEVAPPLEIPACAVGQDHWRPRYWIVGHANGHSKSERAIYEETPRLQKHATDNGGTMGRDDGVPTRMDRLAMLGNAIVPQISEMIGRAILAAEQQANER